MSRLTAEAARQVEGLIDFYLLEKQRPEAARRQQSDIAKAWDQIKAAPTGRASSPRPYPSLAYLGFRWIKARMYRVSWGVTADGPIITNVLYNRADLEDRAASGLEETQE